MGAHFRNAAFRRLIRAAVKAAGLAGEMRGSRLAEGQDAATCRGRSQRKTDRGVVRS